MKLAKVDVVDVATVLAVAATGLLRLPQPLHGDTVSFLHGGDVLLHGRLYSDFWDIKPPGIFYFFALGGLLFGFDEIGLHLFELVFMTVMAAVTLLGARALPGRSRRFANVLVLLTYVPHYALGTCFFALQIEGIVGPLMLACAWLGLRESKGSRFASGCLAAIIIALKQLFAPLVLVFWLVAIRERGGKREALRTALPMLGGSLLGAALLALPFALQGTLGEVMRVLFVYPIQNFGNTQSKVTVLTDAFWWFAPFFPLLALGLVGAAGRSRDRAEPILLCVLAWIVLGFVLIGIQRVSLWAYHFQLVAFPAGILAANAIDWMAEALPAHREMRWAWRGAIVLSLLPFLGHLIRPLGLLVRRGFPRTAEQRREHQIALADPHAYYDSVIPEADYLAAETAPTDDVYVLGNPLILHLAGRRQRSLRNEPWTPRMWPPSKWPCFTEDFEQNQPKLIFLATEFLDFDRGREFAARLAPSYTRTRQSESGQWWKRIDH